MKTTKKKKTYIEDEIDKKQSDYTNPTSEDMLEIFEKAGLLEAYRNIGLNALPYHDAEKLHPFIKAEFEEAKSKRMHPEDDFKRWAEKWLKKRLEKFRGTPDMEVNLEKCIQKLKKEIARPKKELTYKELFKNPDHPEIVEHLFETNDYTEEGTWIDTKKEKKIATAFFVLQDNNIIVSGKKVTQLRAWCNHFGFKPNESQMRNLTKRPQYELEKKEDYKDFLDLFGELLKG